MPADDDWVLYAGYNDKTLMRNVLAYETARRLGRYASRTRFVEVTLNGRYHGVYVLMEKLEAAGGPDRPARARAAAGVDVPLPGAQQGTLVPAARSGATASCSRTPSARTSTRKRRARIRRSIAAAERALYGDGFRDPRRLARHLDEGAAVDFILVNELFKNQDAFHASTFLARGAGGRWQLGPVWDFDISMGNSDYGPSATARRARCSRTARGRGGSTRDPAFVARGDRALARAARRRPAAATCCAASAGTRGGWRATGAAAAQLPPLARARRARLAEPARGGPAHDVRERGGALRRWLSLGSVDGPPRGRSRAGWLSRGFWHRVRACQPPANTCHATY